jgi:hypothetical protein
VGFSIVGVYVLLMTGDAVGMPRTGAGLTGAGVAGARVVLVVFDDGADEGALVVLFPSTAGQKLAEGGVTFTCCSHQHVKIRWNLVSCRVRVSP